MFRKPCHVPRRHDPGPAPGLLGRRRPEDRRPGGGATLGLDGLSSAAYGPEAALTILAPLALLGILYLSYRQTIAAYPTGGGSYTVATGAALAVILVAKFKDGAWITTLIIPALVALFLMIRRHYKTVARETRCPHPLDLSDNQPPVVVVPFEGWDLQTERALRFALRLSPDVIGVHVSVAEDGSPQEEQDDLRRLWAREVEEPTRRAGLPVPRLEIIPSPFRRVVKPLLDFVRALQGRSPGRIVAVVVPELVETRWWELLLHNHLATALKAALLLSGLRRVVVINIPWYLKDRVPQP